MNPRVVRVRANDDYTLVVTFTNGETRLYDMKPYLNHGIFVELKDLTYFKAARPVRGTVQWPHEQDICPDTLYEESVPYKESRPSKGPRRPSPAARGQRPRRAQRHPAQLRSGREG